MLINLRNYYVRRYKASIRLQCQIRIFIAKCRLYHLKRNKAIIIIQCRIRQYLSRLKILFLIHFNAAVRIQMKFRCHIAYKKRISLKEKWNSKTIIVWYRFHTWRILKKKIRNMIRCVLIICVFILI